MTTQQAITEIEAVEFGDAEDYYPEPTGAQRTAWAADENEWQDARDALVEALECEDSAAATEALDRVSRAERDWGDDPSTQRARALFAAAITAGEGEYVDNDGDCRRCGHPANGSSGHGSCDSPAHR